ncbi:GTP cyclohydrolase II [Sphingomonas glacialis]|uniref:GTP cyclohydrolase II n=1 Tax=Sphingomonas glacialis TaxID=658225 RepID=A0A502FZX7_9SPHN|nr:GTP cyclohydrolase II [Sphingomonas glacialis]TPG55065.1 GTP cyclohydrolase II [Sphingomonas glacialis]
MIERLASAELATLHGSFDLTVYGRGDEMALVLTRGLDGVTPETIVRIQSSCLFGETFGSVDCDCRWQIHHSLDLIEEAGSGAFIYLFQEGRGIGLVDKVRAYAVEQEHKCNTVEAFRILGFPSSDLRNYDLAVDIIRQLELGTFFLLTGDDQKVDSLSAVGLDVRKRTMLEEPIDFKRLIRFTGGRDPTRLLNYLKAKHDLMGNDMNADALAEIMREAKASRGEPDRSGEGEPA